LAGSITQPLTSTQSTTGTGFAMLVDPQNMFNN
jgi:hypothetical protein